MRFYRAATYLCVATLASFEGQVHADGLGDQWAIRWLPQVEWSEVKAETATTRAARLVRAGRFIDAEKEVTTALAGASTLEDKLWLLMSLRRVLAQRIAFPGSGTWLAGDVLVAQHDALGLFDQADRGLESVATKLSREERSQFDREAPYDQAFSALTNLRSVLRTKRWFDYSSSDFPALMKRIGGQLPGNEKSKERRWLGARIEAESAWAAGAAEEATDIALKTVAAAVSERAWCAAGELAMLAGDVLAAPFGPVETLGVDAGMIGFMSGALRSGVVPVPVFPEKAGRPDRAERHYMRAGAYLRKGRCGDEGALLLRRAYLAWCRGRADSSPQFRHAADVAQDRGESRTAALARLAAGIVGNDVADVQLAVRQAASRADIGTVVAAGRLVEFFALRLWFVQHDADRAIAELSSFVDAARSAGFHQTAADAASSEAEILTSAGRTELVIPIQQKVVELRNHHLEALRVALAGQLADPALTKSAAEALSAAEISLWEARLQLISSYGKSVVNEGAQSWLVRFKSERKTVEPALRTAEKAGFPMREALDAIDLAFWIRIAINAEAGSPDRAAAFERARRVASKDAKQELAVDIVEADEQPLARERARRSLARLDPVGNLRSQLAKATKPPTILQLLDVARALGDVKTLASMAVRLEAFSDLSRWLTSLAELARANRAIPCLSHIASYYEALVAQDRRDLGGARRLLEGMLERQGELEPDLRVEVTDSLIEILAASGEAEGSLLLLETLEEERLALQALRGGRGDAMSRAFAERLALERSVALGIELDGAQSSHLEDLRMRTKNLSPRRDRPRLSRIRRAIASLDGNGVMLAMYPGPRFIVEWVYSRRQGLRAIVLAAPTRPTLRKAQRLWELIAGQRPGWESIAAEMNGILLTPAGTIPDSATVIIHAIGRLGQLPFEVLGENGGTSLGTRHPIVYIDRLVDTEQEHGSVSIRPARSGNVIVGINSEGLSFAEDEARAIAAELGSPALLGDDANLGVVKDRMKSGRLVHIAAHGALRADNPFRSFIELGRGERLEAWKLLAEAGPAELVVLSACQTRLDIDAGETSRVGSLATAAHAGGARFVIASRWRADDAVASELFVNFYHSLQAGKTIPLAFHEVKRPPAGEHPYFREAFALSARSLEALEVSVRRP